MVKYYDVIKKLKSADVSTLLDDVQMLLKETHSCSEMVNILRGIYHLVKGEEACTKVESNCTFDFIPCINLCVDYLLNHFTSDELNANHFANILYYFIRNFIGAELYSEALSLADILKNFITHPDNNANDKSSYTQNMNILLWNEALKREKKSLCDLDESLCLRIKAIEFLMLHANLPHVNEKVVLMINRYIHDNKNMEFENVFTFLQKFWLEVYNKDCSSTDRVLYVKVMYSWLNVLLKHINGTKYLELFVSWFADLTNFNSKKNQSQFFLTSIDASTLFLKFFSLKNSTNVSKSTLSRYEKAFNRFKYFDNEKCELFTLVCKFFYLNFVTNVKSISESQSNFITALKSNLQFCVVFVRYYLNISFKKKENNSHSILNYKLQISHCLVNLFQILLKSEPDAAFRKHLLETVQSFIEFSLEQLKLEENEEKINLQGYAKSIVRIGMYLYTTELHAESCYFLETSCSVLYEYIHETSIEAEKHGLWRIQESLAIAYLLSGRHEEALLTIGKCLLMHENKLKQCMDIWRRIKKDASKSGHEKIISRNISDILLQLNSTIDADKEIKLLYEELKTCSSDRYTLEEEVLTVTARIFEKSSQNRICASTFLKVVCMKKSLKDQICSFLKKSCIEMCLESIEIFKDYIKENSVDNVVKLELSSAYFWLYQFKLRELHEISDKEAENALKPSPVIKAENKLNDCEDENDICDIKPAFPLVTLAVEVEITKILDQALEIWSDVFNDPTYGYMKISAAIKENAILEIMQATAEIYATIAQDVNELKMLVILQKVSEAMKNKEYELLASISLINSLVKLGYLQVAAKILHQIEKDVLLLDTSDINLEVVCVKFGLAKSNFCFYSGQFDDGFRVLQEISKRHVFEKMFKCVKLLQADLSLQLSFYLSLPVAAFRDPSIVEHLQTNTALASALKAMSLYKALLKHLSEKENCTSVTFSTSLLRSILKSYLHLGELYFECGEPRFARCYLQEGLRLAESILLTYWSSKMLIVLAQVDLSCDNVTDCLVKINGLKYINDKSQDAASLLSATFLQIENSMVPDSPDELEMFTGSVRLQRNVKHDLINDINIESSPIARRKMRSNADKHAELESEEFFSNYVTLLEISLLSCSSLVSKGSYKDAENELKSLFQNCTALGKEINLLNVLTTIKRFFHTDSDRSFTRAEVMILIATCLNLYHVSILKNNIQEAEYYLNYGSSFLSEKIPFSKYMYPNIFGCLKYFQICIYFKKSLKLSSLSSVIHHMCPSVKCVQELCLKSSNGKLSTDHVQTPKNKTLPQIRVTRIFDKAPVKKDILSTVVKKDLEFLNSSGKQVLYFSDSDDEIIFNGSKFLPKPKESSKLRTRKKILKSESENSNDSSYKFFKSKNDHLGVSSAGDIWSLSMLCTPKTNKSKSKRHLYDANPVKIKENRTKVKPVKSTSNAGKVSKKSKGTRKLNKVKCNITSCDSSRLSQDFVTHETSVENSRSSPHDNKIVKRSSIHEHIDIELKSFQDDSVFNSPNKEHNDILEQLCREINSVCLSKKTSLPTSSIPDKQIDEVIGELMELKSHAQMSLLYPLYPNVCRLLAILIMIKLKDKSEEDQSLKIGYLLSETFSTVLRHIYISNLVYFKDNEITAEKQTTLESLKMINSSMDSQMKFMLSFLPKNWTVVQVNALPSESSRVSKKIPNLSKFIICQYRRDTTPLIITTDSSTNTRLNCNFLAELSNILEENALTMKSKDSKLWWQTRSSLDARLKHLAHDMENIWLGCWKGLFLGIPTSEERIKQLCNDTGLQPLLSADKKLLQVLLDSASFLTREQLSAAVCHLWSCNPLDEVHSKLCNAIRNISYCLSETERHPVILILDKNIQSLPWECMPVLHGVPVSRMPSFSLLSYKLSSFGPQSTLYQGLDENNTYYILNPSGDLKKTQKFFQEKFERQSKWVGIVGKVPEHNEYAVALQDHDFFLYCGHGSGKHYLQNISIDKLKNQAAALLMGCSSGRLNQLGRQLEAHGIALRFLLSGCPCVVGNLWDVTDNDIDRFMEEMLQLLMPNYGESQTSVNICKAVSLARNKCKMSYLVGAAPVVYGFPIFASNTSDKNLSFGRS